MKGAFFYPKLAANGISKNKQTYLPYILTCAGMIMMYYITSFLRYSALVAEMKGGYIMQGMLAMGCGVMVIFSAIFLFYTNSFLIRRRKKEFGLYNILGMGKKNIALIMIWETVMIFAVSFIAGIGCGILFSKAAELLAANIISGDINYSFTVEAKAIKQALAYYAVIFVMILLNALRQIHLSNPIELLHSENTGEKPPKANWFLAAAGAVLLAVSYYMAVTIKNPLAAIFVFFAAVIMVIIATYLLFIAGSVAVCKILQGNKKYYYKTNHFVSVSQMAYRMKRNGAGLASICILSTMVLVTLSSTVCLYIGEEDILRLRYPRNIIVDTYSADEEDVSKINEIVKKTLDEYDTVPENILRYTYLDISGAFEGNNVVLDPEKRDELSDSINPDIRKIIIIPLDDYNSIMGENETLSKGEVIIYSEKAEFGYGSITLEGAGTFAVKKEAKDFTIIGDAAVSVIPTLYMFVPDMETVTKLYEMQLGIYESSSFMHSYCGFDLSCDDDTQAAIADSIDQKIKEEKANWNDFPGVGTDCAAKDRLEFYALYGGLFFLGMILGSVFICAAVLIMYYKQVSEGYEDKIRFEILQKVGMSKREIKQSINSQVLTVFFLPLIAAGVHTAFAFPIISQLLMLFSLTDTSLFAIVSLCCFGVFAVLYIAAYIFTSRSYLSIVSERNR